jgi:hypothetical protein
MATATKSAVIKPGTDEAVINLDFRNVGPRGGGKAAHVPEGDYLLELTAAKNAPVANSTNRQVALQFRIIGTPPHAEAKAGMGDTVYQNAQLGEKSLWFLRNMLEDLLGKEVTGKAITLTFAEHIGKRVGATLADGKPYTNKDGDETVRSEVKYTFPAARFVGYNPALGGSSEQPDEEDAPAPKAAQNGRASAQEAAAAVTESSADDDEIQIEELENI